MGGGGQCGCEWRSEAFVRGDGKKFGGGDGRVGSGGGSHRGGGGGGSGWGCQGGWERRIEAFVKIQKNFFFLGGGGGRGGTGWM